MLHEQGFRIRLSLWPSMWLKMVLRVQVLARRLLVPRRACFCGQGAEVCALRLLVVMQMPLAFANIRRNCPADLCRVVNRAYICPVSAGQVQAQSLL